MSPDTEEFSEALENLSELSLEDTTFYLCFISTCATVLIAQHITVAPCSKCSGAILAAFIWEQQKIQLEVAEDWGKCVPSSARTYTYVICSAGLGRLRWSAPDNWLLGGSFSSLGKPSCRGCWLQQVQQVHTNAASARWTHSSMLPYAFQRKISI